MSEDSPSFGQVLCDFDEFRCTVGSLWVNVQTVPRQDGGYGGSGVLVTNFVFSAGNNIVRLSICC